MTEKDDISFDDLSDLLAIKALQNIGLPSFTVIALLDAADQEMLTNFKLFGAELARAYQQGFEVGRGKAADVDLAEAHEHEAAKLNSESGEQVGADWLISPVTIVDDKLMADLTRKP